MIIIIVYKVITIAFLIDLFDFQIAIINIFNSFLKKVNNR